MREMEKVSIVAAEKVESRENVMIVHDVEEMGPEARKGNGAEKMGTSGKSLCGEQWQ